MSARDPSRSDVTRLLHDWTEGDGEALHRLMPIVVAELRDIAERYLVSERVDHTLQPTALVNEVYLKLVDRDSVQWKNRAQFFGFSAQLMRRILVDHARAKNTAKRGSEVQKVSLDQSHMEIPVDRDVDLVALDDALERLEELDPRQAKIVELRFFAGLTNEEVADYLEVSPTTVKREWTTARRFLKKELR